MRPIYLALDFNDRDSLFRWAAFAKDHSFGIKIGLEAFVSFGPSLVRELKAGDHSIFLDLKLFDIPQTVLKTLDAVKDLGVKCVSLHGLCNDEVWTKLHKSKALRAYAVTVLTSMGDEDLSNRGWANPVGETVDALVKHLSSLGQKLFICSVKERERIRQVCPGAEFICPGIRFGDGVHDQKRVGGADELRDSRGTYFVVGRAITESANPVKVAEQIGQWLT